MISKVILMMNKFNLVIKKLFINHYTTMNLNNKEKRVKAIRNTDSKIVKRYKKNLIINRLIISNILIVNKI